MSRAIFLACTLLTFFGHTAISQVNLNNGLEAYYPFNGSLQDLSGNNNSGIGYGGITYGADQWGNANSSAYFDGQNDWIEVPSSSHVTPGKHLSVAFRFKTKNDSYQQDLFTKSDYAGTSAPNNFQYYIGFKAPSLPDDGIFFGTSHNNTCFTSSFLPAQYCITPTPIVQDKWYCVVATFDSGVQKIFIDGVLTMSNTVSGPYSASIDSCISGILKMGVWWQSDPTYFYGNLDEVRIYNRRLNTAEIDSLCNFKSANPEQPNLVGALVAPVGMTISPNPASGDIYIVPATAKTQYSVNIYNELGQSVYNSANGNPNTPIPCSHLPAGIYFVQLNQAGELITGKFSKQ